jgi:hypothetical protein
MRRKLKKSDGWVEMGIARKSPKKQQNKTKIAMKKVGIVNIIKQIEEGC